MPRNWPRVSMLAVAVFAGSVALADGITPDAVASRPAGVVAGGPDRAALLEAILVTPISLEIDDVPLRQAIDSIRAQMGVELVARYANERLQGLDADARVTLRAAGEPAVRVIERLLGMVEETEPGTWQLRDGFIEIGPKARLDQARETRCYSVRDLLFEPVSFTNAPVFNLQSSVQQGNSGGSGGSTGGGGGFGGGGSSGGGGAGSGGIFGPPGEEPVRPTAPDQADRLKEIIQETVESERWIENGGAAASIRYHQGVFIVVAPDYIHRQLAWRGTTPG